MSCSATAWVTDVFSRVFGQQWSSKAQMDKLYQMNTQTILVSVSLYGIC